MTFTFVCSLFIFFILISRHFQFLQSHSILDSICYTEIICSPKLTNIEPNKLTTLMTYRRWRGWCHCQLRWCNLVVGDFFPLWVRQLLPTPDFEPCLLISKSTEYFIGYSARRRLKCWYFVAFSPKHASTPFDTPLTQPSLSSSGAED